MEVDALRIAGRPRNGEGGSQDAGSVHGVLSESDDPSTLRIATETGLCLEFEKVLPYGPNDSHFVGVLTRAVGVRVRVEQQVLLLGARELPHLLSAVSLVGVVRRSDLRCDT